MRFLFYNLLIVTLLFTSCKKDENTTPEPTINEDASTFKEIATISIGGIGAAEITAYDASYVNLARKLNIPLCTSDKKLAKVASKYCDVICYN